ncbi:MULTISPECIES: hypothetical protein [Elizabethkingia]|uniref:Uncharacterized protein n=2 Tax=Elizabethkingia anophelis TaxID=1117645 RepID=A0A455ZFF5_9FLAO|nr:hypothetical protein [Elizabethkingia anophelis]ATC37745.1 hypothetical protein BAZ09_016510 [Elizabethkingia anophelis R26]ATC41425.1 hypothetical protein EAAG1_016725 [Elizabethkingia anophelis Ag1]ATC45102.1 hypothetical protein CMV41_16725 [Elizabethkingia anophelis]ATC48778.1 hypothetical protein CMV40_16725 [Elizabethkingia anophelis]ELR81278.1 hypothetical protein D505_00120 [Elizabethkingia anophelis R26]
MKLKKILNIEAATSFKLEYYEGGSELKTKIFNTYKAMEQFHTRQTDFMYLDCNRYAMIKGKWERFIKIPSTIVFEENLEFIVKSFNDVVEEKDLQKFKNED